MDIIKKANDLRVKSQIEEWTEGSKGCYALLASHLKAMYEECKEVGFNDEQSFIFAKEYVIRNIFKAG